jgi:hypothetical protein
MFLDSAFIIAIIYTVLTPMKEKESTVPLVVERFAGGFLAGRPGLQSKR